MKITLNSCCDLFVTGCTVISVPRPIVGLGRLPRDRRKRACIYSRLKRWRCLFADSGIRIHFLPISVPGRYSTSPFLQTQLPFACTAADDDHADHRPFQRTDAQNFLTRQKHTRAATETVLEDSRVYENVTFVPGVICCIPLGPS